MRRPIFVRLRAQLNKTLDLAGVPVALGGFDISLNEHESGLFKPHYQPHAEVFAPLGFNKHDIVRRHFTNSKIIRRSVFVQAFDGNNAALAYAIKGNFSRRVTLSRHTRGGRTEQRQNTRLQPLRPLQKVELWKGLDRAGLWPRLFTHGVEITESGEALGPLFAQINGEHTMTDNSDGQRHVIKLENAEDEATGDAFEIFKFSKVGKRSGTLRIPRQQARDAKIVLGLLIGKNADLPLDKEETIVKAAIDSLPAQKVLYSAQCGWRLNREAFVTPRRVIDTKHDRVRKLLPPAWLNEQHSLPMNTAGTLKEWQKLVAAPAKASDVAILSLSMAFAAPLLPIVGLQPFGVNLYGRSKVGKTAAALVGASVIGIGRESDLPNWASTLSSMLEHARIYNGLLFPVNEMGLLSGSRRAAYSDIRTFIYRMCEGRDRQRHSASIYASHSRSADFATLFLSTAEHSVSQYAAFSGETRDDGEYARCVDVPATTDHRTTIITRYPDDVPKKERSTWARNQVIGLRRACEKQYGTAFEPFITHVAANREIERDIAKYQKEFRSDDKHPQVIGAREHAADNFSLIYAGGCIAVNAGILPWDHETLRRAVMACFVRAMAEIEALEPPLAPGKRKLRQMLTSPSIVKLSSGSSFSEKENPGFYEYVEGLRQYTIHSSAFSSWFQDRQESIILEWLNRRGYLIPKSSRTTSPPNDSSKSWAEQTPKWPNGKSVRSIVFRDPFKVKAKRPKR